jgi:hypothetical protein
MLPYVTVQYGSEYGIKQGMYGVVRGDNHDKMLSSKQREMSSNSVHVGNGNSKGVQYLQLSKNATLFNKEMRISNYYRR